MLQEPDASAPPLRNVGVEPSILKSRRVTPQQIEKSSEFKRLQTSSPKCGLEQVCFLDKPYAYAWYEDKTPWTQICT